MSETIQIRTGEESLDPQSWEEMRALGHRMVDDVLGWMASHRERPAWRPVPEEVEARFRGPLPREPQGAEAAYRDFQRDVLPYPVGNVHPRFWGWVAGTGTPLGALGDFLAASLNSSAAGFDDASGRVESQVLDWLREMLGFPAATSGLLTSGCSMAQVIGLAVARHVKAGFDVGRRGLVAAERPPALYASSQTHSSVKRAVELLGLGRESLRLLPVGADHRLDLGALRAAVAADRRAGFQPLCAIGNAGTVNAGATDDLEGLAEICAAEDLWLHVDGAFGALAWLCPELRPQLAGLQRADSLAFDLHKWMYLPFEVGCIFTRSEAEQFATFQVDSEYLQPAARGTRSGRTRWHSDYGPQLTRGFRALKVWLSLKEHGVDRYARIIRQNVEQARYLARRVEAEPRLELVGPVPLNVVCFRYRRSGLDLEQLNALNAELLADLQEGGRVVVSHTVLDGRFVLRAAITNHRSRRDDFDVLVDEVLRLGEAASAPRASESEPREIKEACP